MYSRIVFVTICALLAASTVVGLNDIYEKAFIHMLVHRPGGTGVIECIVLDKQTEQPVIGAEVRFEGTSLVLHLRDKVVFAPLRPSKYSITITHPHYQAVSIEEVRVSKDSITKIVAHLEYTTDSTQSEESLLLGPDYIVTIDSLPEPGFGNIIGQVVERKSRKPVASAKVTVLQTEKSTLTDQDGKYLIVEAKSGKRMELGISHPDYESMFINIARVYPSETRQVDAALEKRQIDEARLYSELFPFVRLEYTVNSWSSTSWSRSCYEIRTTTLQLKEGQEFGAPRKGPAWRDTKPFRLERIISPDTILVSFNEFLVVVGESIKNPSKQNPKKVGVDEVCFRTRSYDAGTDFCMRVVRQ